MKLLLALLTFLTATSSAAEPLKLTRDGHWLIIHGGSLPGEVRINYLEAYCRPGSTKRKWEQTTIGHTTRLVSSFTGPVVLIPTSGSTWTLTTGGNIALAVTSVDFKALIVVFDSANWHPSYA